MTNSTSETSQSPKCSDHGEILKQVEFYFSDSNLPYDKFLYKTTSANCGWIPIKTVHSFKRMQRFGPFEEVVAALRKSQELLEVSEDGERVRRRIPLKLPTASENINRFARTIYAKGFGEEKATSQLDIENFFANFGQINQVRLRRRGEDHQFKGSVFVEFTNQEDANKFLEQDPKPRFEDQELAVMSKQAYVEMKSEQYKFSGRNNGRRKPIFNAYKEIQSQEPKKRKDVGKRKRDFKKKNSGENNDREKRSDSENIAEDSAKDDSESHMAKKAKLVE